MRDAALYAGLARLALATTAATAAIACDGARRPR